LPITRQGESSRWSLRVINVASASYTRGRLAHLLPDVTSSMTSSSGEGDIYQMYADSKLAMMLFTTELNFREATNNVVCLAAHPGKLISPYPLISHTVSIIIPPPTRSAHT